MSCINLRLPPARRAWKSFTYTLQTKLRKLNKSKAIKKPSNKYRSNTPRVLSSDKKGRRGFLHPPGSRNKSIRFRFHKKAAPPVFVDRLFQEPLTAGLVSVKCPPPSAKNSKILDCQATNTMSGTSKKGGEDAETTCPADDMWESVGFASPQMHRIDERAEQFISSFRAEMELQETKARAL